MIRDQLGHRARPFASSNGVRSANRITRGREPGVLVTSALVNCLS